MNDRSTNTPDAFTYMRVNTAVTQKRMGDRSTATLGGFTYSSSAIGGGGSLDGCVPLTVSLTASTAVTRTHIFMGGRSTVTLTTVSLVLHTTAAVTKRCGRSLNSELCGCPVCVGLDPCMTNCSQSRFGDKALKIIN